MGHFVCILFMTAPVCQLVPYAFVFFPASERSSTKSPCRQVNEFFAPLKALIFHRKLQNGAQSPPPAWRPFRRAQALIFEAKIYLTDFCASQ
jgi:hypothetical protein